jgi:FkbM family methyltransferase
MMRHTAKGMGHDASEQPEFPLSTDRGDAWPWAAVPDSHRLPVASGFEPRISIIIPSLQQGSYLEEAIRSVLLQQYPNLELIVIDGGSTDESLEIIRRYSPWLSFWTSEPDRGQADAINKGLTHVTGEIFTWLNADDLLLPGSLDTVAESARKHPGSVLAGSVVYFSDDGKERVRRQARLDRDHLLQVWRSDRAEFHDQGLFYPTTLISRIGHLDASLSYTFDFEFLVRTTLVTDVTCIEQPLARFRLHESSKTGSQAVRFIDEEVEVIERYRDQMTDFDERAFVDFIAGAKLRRGVRSLGRGGMRLVIEAVRSRPIGAVRTSVLASSKRLLRFAAAGLEPLRRRVRLRTRIRQFSDDVSSLRYHGAVRYNLARYLLPRLKKGVTVRLTSPLSDHPLLCRAGTSDLEVFEHVFLQREYQCVDSCSHVQLIIDCGANVGYSAAYFLSRFPEARLIAVEPDRDNVALLLQNLAPWKDRVEICDAALWSHPTELVMVPEPYRDGLEWTRQVREPGPEEAGAIRAVDIPQLLRSSGQSRISILKIDIEGAEAVVFGDGRPEWLERVDHLVIELHDDSIFGNATQPFMRAIADEPFEITTAGELTVCRRDRSREEPQ